MQAAVLSISNLVSDSYFNAFTRPIINKKIEEKTCGEGPNLAEVLEDDNYMVETIQKIMV